MNSQVFNTTNLSDLSDFVQWFSQQIKPGSWVYLQGDLGVGKTTFCQQIIHALGFTGAVTSPTYALMNSYPTSKGDVIHCDLYRLADPEELYEIGLLDIANESNALVLIEWPEKGRGVLPQADYIIKFELSVCDGKTCRSTTLIEHKSS